ncbi:glycosyltransferase family 4 protein [Thermaurantiacus sp.]
MHLLFTGNSAWGIAHFRWPLLEAFAARGDRLTILAPPDGAEDKFSSLGARFVPLAMDQKGLNPVTDLQLMQRLKVHFAAERPDTILSFTIKNNIWGAIAARPLAVPFIPNVSGLGTAFLSGGMVRSVAEGLYRRAFKTLPTVFFQNPEDRDLFVQRRLVRSSQARLLPGSGIDLAHFQPRPPDASGRAPVFLMIGRIIRDKGVFEFVAAARAVKAVIPAARFQLLGPMGVQNRGAISEGDLKQWVAEGTIEYLGATDDVRPMVAAADCVVLPSYREGAPRVLIEAGAMGRPVIATDVPGCRSVVQAGVTGLLCAVRDAQSLADSCLSFAGMSFSERLAMGQAARRRMEARYDERLVVDAYQSAIAEGLSLAKSGISHSRNPT